MSLELDLDDKVALTILYKVYARKGSGRKDSALQRGLEPSIRDRVGPVRSRLVSLGYLATASRGSVTLYLQVKRRGPEVAQILANPSGFSLGHLGP
jgi:hypothetical protein